MLDTKGQLDRYASGSIESTAIDFYTGIIKGVAFSKSFWDEVGNYEFFLWRKFMQEWICHFICLL